MKDLTPERRLTLQFYWAVAMIALGIALLATGMLLPPIGIIHNSVLIAFGEICTFAGALIGVDYHYRYKNMTDRKDK